MPSLKNFNLLVNITCFFSKPHFDKGCEKRILIPINRFSHRCMYRKDMSPLCICTRCSHLIYCHYSQRVHTICYEMTVCMKLAIGLCSDSIINLYCTLKYSLLINLPAYLSLFLVCIFFFFSFFFGTEDEVKVERLCFSVWTSTSTIASGKFTSATMLVLLIRNFNPSSSLKISVFKSLVS